MLIKVFGIWLMASNINHLEPHGFNGANCWLFMNAKSKYSYVISTNETCDDAAVIINKQIKNNP